MFRSHSDHDMFIPSYQTTPAEIDSTRSAEELERAIRHEAHRGDFSALAHLVRELNARYPRL